MKVKLIYSKPNPRILGIEEWENEINDFIRDKNVIDIKFQRVEISMSALIIYEED